MKSRATRKPIGSTRRFETLESRRLLAGDMTNAANPLDANNDFLVSATDANGEVGLLEAEEVDSEFSIHIEEGSSLRVHFEGIDTLVNISSPEKGKLRFQIDDEFDQTISIKHHLWIDVGGEHSKLLFDRASIANNLFVNFGGSENAISLSDSRVGGVFLFEGSDRDDTVIIDDGSKVELSVVIKTKSGDDTVLVQDASIWLDFSYHAGDDEGMFAAYDASFGTALVALMQDGDDQVSLQGINVKYAAVVNGGRNKDSLAVSDINAPTFIDQEFEFEGELKDVSALSDEVCAGFVHGENGAGPTDKDPNGDGPTDGDLSS